MQNNPWKTIWLEPRKTTRDAIDSSVQPLPLILFLIMMIGGLEAIINYLDDAGSAVATPSLVTYVIAGVIIGVISWFVSAFLLSKIGGFLGGASDSADMRTAVGISMIPTFTATVFSFLALMSTYIGQMQLGLMLSLPSMVFGLWGVITGVKAISEAHRFSSWLGLATLLLTVALLTFIIFVILTIIGVLIGILF